MAITRFTGDFAWLSNLYPSEMVFMDRDFPSAETAFQWARTSNNTARQALRTMDGPTARRYGRRLPTIDRWSDKQPQILNTVLCRKFRSSSPATSELGELTMLLEKTGDEELVYGNFYHENLLGSCQCDKCGNKGENMLGKLLVLVRAKNRGNVKIAKQPKGALPSHELLGLVLEDLYPDGDYICNDSTQIVAVLDAREPKNLTYEYILTVGINHANSRGDHRLAAACTVALENLYIYCDLQQRQQVGYDASIDFWGSVTASATANVITR
jgi:hypothetical protein